MSIAIRSKMFMTKRRTISFLLFCAVVYIFSVLNSDSSPKTIQESREDGNEISRTDRDDSTVGGDIKIQMNTDRGEEDDYQEGEEYSQEWEGENLQMEAMWGEQEDLIEQELVDEKYDQARVAQAVYNDLRGDTNNKFPHNVLLLASMGRSGSSFTGALLNSQVDSIYYFEPLHDLEAQNVLTPESATWGLKHLFLCDIQDPILSAFIKTPKFSTKQFLKECPDEPTCFTQEGLNAGCKNKTVRVVKVIRFRVAWLEPFLTDPTVNTKVVHIVRDPRASVISGWARGWTLSPSKCCASLSDDLNHGKRIRQLYPDKYMAVRYEDLCENPRDMATQIFQFLGYPDLPESTAAFLAQTTTKAVDKNPYSLQRNTSAMQQKWRWEIKEQQLASIQEGCKDVLDSLGLSLFDGLASVRDKSKPLFRERHNDLFNYRIP